MDELKERYIKAKVLGAEDNDLIDVFGAEVSRQLEDDLVVRRETLKRKSENRIKKIEAKDLKLNEYAKLFPYAIKVLYEVLNGTKGHSDEAIKVAISITSAQRAYHSNMSRVQAEKEMPTDDATNFPSLAYSKNDLNG